MIRSCTSAKFNINLAKFNINLIKPFENFFQKQISISISNIVKKTCFSFERKGYIYSTLNPAVQGIINEQKQF